MKKDVWELLFGMAKVFPQFFLNHFEVYCWSKMVKMTKSMARILSGPICLSCFIFTTQLLYFCCDSSKKIWKLRQLSKQWNLKETGANYKVPLLSKDNALQKSSRKLRNQTNLDKTEKQYLFCVARFDTICTIQKTWKTLMEECYF